MIMKIDTQGMSYGTGKGNGKSLEEQRASIPDVKPKQINIISDSLKEEFNCNYNYKTNTYYPIHPVIHSN